MSVAGSKAGAAPELLDAPSADVLELVERRARPGELDREVGIGLVESG